MSQEWRWAAESVSSVEILRYAQDDKRESILDDN